MIVEVQSEMLSQVSFSNNFVVTVVPFVVCEFKFNKVRELGFSALNILLLILSMLFTINGLILSFCQNILRNRNKEK